MLLLIVIKCYLHFLSQLPIMFPGEPSPEGKQHGCSHQPNYIPSMKLIEGKQLFRLHCAYLIFSCFENLQQQTSNASSSLIIFHVSCGDFQTVYLQVYNSELSSKTLSQPIQKQWNQYLFCLSFACGFFILVSKNTCSEITQEILTENRSDRTCFLTNAIKFCMY